MTAVPVSETRSPFRRTLILPPLAEICRAAISLLPSRSLLD